MAKYTVYDRETGVITQSGASSNPMIWDTPIHGVILGIDLDDSLYKINTETLEPIELDTVVNIVPLLRQIDEQAEHVRSLFITNTPSQPAVYMAKEAEAMALMSDPEISESLTPNITMEATRTGETRFDVAVVILTQANAWRQISAIIEDRRLSAKEQVRNTKQPYNVDWSDIEALAPSEE